MIRHTGRLGSKYSRCSWYSRAAGGGEGKLRAGWVGGGSVRELEWEFRGVRGPGRDMRHHLVQTQGGLKENTEKNSRESKEHGTRFIYLASNGGRNNGRRCMGCS